MKHADLWVEMLDGSKPFKSGKVAVVDAEDLRIVQADAKAEGRREGLEEAAVEVEQAICHATCERPRCRQAMGYAAHIRKLIEKPGGG